jgi:putative addiction module component (TIGR02574 family)
MTDRSNQVLKDALSLSPTERAELAEHVLASLDTPERRRIDQAWAAESEERLDAFERGEIADISAEDVFGRYRKPMRG